MAVACVVCGSNDLQEDDGGFLVCRICGLQSQEVLSEEMEYDANLMAGYGVNINTRSIEEASEQEMTWRSCKLLLEGTCCI